MVYPKILECVGKKKDIKEAGAGKKQNRILLCESMCFVGDLNKVTRKSTTLDSNGIPYANFCSICIIPNTFVSY